MATIHVNRAGQSLGTFTEDEIRDGLGSGRFTGSDLAWKEGMASWQPLSTFTEFATASAAAPASESTPPFGTHTTPPPVVAPTSTILASSPPPASGRTEPLAIWSLVLSCLSLVCCGLVLGIPGVICGHLALSKMKAQPSLEGRGMATAGIIIGYIAIALWLVWVVFFGGVSFLQSITQSR